MAISYLYTGEPMNGTGSDDFVIAFKGSTGTDNNTINGNNGDDLVVGDSSDTWIPNGSYNNNAIGTAFNLETLTSTWTTAENPMFGDYTIPHTTVMAESTIGQSEYYRIAIGAGQQIIIDIDFASNTAIGNPRDLVVELQDSLGNIIATADDSLVTDGGRGSTPSTQGSASSYDPYLVYTVTTGGIYYINVRPFGGGPGTTFTDNNTFVMNVSVTGHAVNATNPVQGADTINGGEGDDTLFGQGGGDIINGGNGNDTIDSGSGGDIVHGDAGNDILYGGDGTEENIHGDADNDILYSGGEGHYYGDAGDDIIYAGLTSGVNEILDGGTGSDTIDTTTWNGTYVVNLVTGATNFGESFTNFENVVTGNGADTITGTAGANVIKTQGGADIINADAGDDIVAGGADGDTMDGGAGFDILDYRLSSGAVTVNLATATASGGHATGDTLVANSFEGVYGSVLGDTLTGDAGDNGLYGFEGNDTLVGGDGIDILDGGINDDVMTGGIGNDTYYVDSVGDVVNEIAGQGTDTLLTSVSYTVAAALSVEIVKAVDPLAITAINLTGNATFNWLVGNAGNNTLSGAGGDDRLEGGAGNDVLNGGANNDLMIGGAGSDQYIVTEVGDTTQELPGGGNDLVTLILAAGGSYTLAAEVEFMTITSNNTQGHGNSMANIISSTGTGNSLYGEGGNDTLNGSANADLLDGGTGADTMKGGAGDDNYVVDDAGDVVTELAAGGTDTVTSSVNWTLGAETENLILTGAALNGTGNALANAITGNANANILDGGAGIDTMTGGLGDDTYIIDNVGDVIVELGGQGIDTVKVGFNYTLVAGPSIEKLATIDASATTAINLTGNATFNWIIGNEGANTLSGAGGDDRLEGGGGNDVLNGGSGNDLMYGGAGSDQYVVTEVGDTTVELAGGGNDLVTLILAAGGSYTLASEVEMMTVTSNNTQGHGNALANILTSTGSNNVLYGEGGNDTLNGNANADTLHGGAGMDTLKGGAGNDVLFGEADADIFFFLTGSGADQIADFVHASDRIDLTAYAIASFAALQGMMSQVGSDTLINLGSGNSITLTGVTMGTLAAGDFILSGGSALQVPWPGEPDANDAAPASNAALQIPWLDDTPPGAAEFAVETSDTGYPMLAPGSIAAVAGMSPAYDPPAAHIYFL